MAVVPVTCHSVLQSQPGACRHRPLDVPGFVRRKQSPESAGFTELIRPSVPSPFPRNPAVTGPGTRAVEGGSDTTPARSLQCSFVAPSLRPGHGPRPSLGLAFREWRNRGHVPRGAQLPTCRPEASCFSFPAACRGPQERASTFQDSALQNPVPLPPKPPNPANQTNPNNKRRSERSSGSFRLPGRISTLRGPVPVPHGGLCHLQVPQPVTAA